MWGKFSKPAEKKYGCAWTAGRQGVQRQLDTYSFLQLFTFQKVHHQIWKLVSLLLTCLPCKEMRILVGLENTFPQSAVLQQPAGLGLLRVLWKELVWSNCCLDVCKFGTLINEIRSTQIQSWMEMLVTKISKDVCLEMFYILVINVHILYISLLLHSKCIMLYANN